VVGRAFSGSVCWGIWGGEVGAVREEKKINVNNLAPRLYVGGAFAEAEFPVPHLRGFDSPKNDGSGQLIGGLVYVSDICLALAVGSSMWAMWLFKNQPQITWPIRNIG